MAAKAFGVAPRYRVLGRPLLRLAGWFDADIRESYDMLYQYDAEYLFDATKFATAFRVTPTSYEAGIAQCVARDSRRPAHSASATAT
jgi:hypothetical protein